LPFVVKALTLVCRVNCHPTISHGFPPAVPTDVRQALAVELADAQPALAPGLVDAPQAQAAACTCYVPSPVAVLA
jgi:hypothetical protein